MLVALPLGTCVTAQGAAIAKQLFEGAIFYFTLMAAIHAEIEILVLSRAATD